MTVGVDCSEVGGTFLGESDAFKSICILFNTISIYIYMKNNLENQVYENSAQKVFWSLSGPCSNSMSVYS